MVFSDKPDSENRLLTEDAESLYEHAPCGYVSIRPDGTVMKINQTLLQWLGYSAEEIVNKKRFQDLLTIGDRIFYETHFSPLLQMQGFVTEINFGLKAKDARAIPVLTSANLVRNQQQTPTLIRITVFNIADRKKYESELLLERRRAEKALRAKSDFVSLLTHEIRTPLNAIIGATHLLADTELSPEQKRYSQMLASSSESLMNLLNSILDFSKIDSGNARIEERSFDFEKSMRLTALGLQGRAVQKGIDLKVEIDSKIPQFLLGDAVKISQILTNLIGNAIKFTDRGSVIVKVDAREISKHDVNLQFAVIDSGIGMGPVILANLFEEYSQSKHEGEKNYGGTGLGLAISQKLAELHGTKIEVQSTEGRGSTFTFTLRLKKADFEPAVTAPPLPPDLLKGKKILVADDSIDNQTLLELIMTKWGVKIKCVSNGKEVLDILQIESFDLILMDLRMPVMDGYATTAAIRASPHTAIAKTPIIAFSASATLGESDIVSDLSFDDILGKPFKPAELFAKIAQLVAVAIPEPVLAN